MFADGEVLLYYQEDDFYRDFRTSKGPYELLPSNIAIVTVFAATSGSRPTIVAGLGLRPTVVVGLGSRAIIASSLSPTGLGSRTNIASGSRTNIASGSRTNTASGSTGLKKLCKNTKKILRKKSD
ncbi:hypothetical protein H5410_062794 [Solanum commersonii]|uniref:Uncharacterized protein n=1 Tax=Solanum commersonii TaxID=4109 RepID=A0A9J5WCK0_SOLCO|nr:hypothetical protein H5410_062794 [Solanum commersonii]